MKTEHILIIRFSAIGDVAMTVPVVYSLAKQYPHLRITVLSRPFAKPFFEHLPPNVGFMEADIKREYKGVKGLNALYRRLIAKQFTAIADFHNILRSNYLRIRFNLDSYRVEHINKHRHGKRLLTSNCNKRLTQQPTSFENYAEVLERLGYPVKLEFETIYPDGPDLSKLPAGLLTEKTQDTPWIGIAPFAAHKGKIYPLEKMVKVIEKIIERNPHCRIFLFGGGADEHYIMNQWEKQFAQCVNASAKLGDMEKELILMSQLDVMVSMDSANMHLASLVNTPVVSVWGATHPYAGFLGWNQSPENVIQLDMDCRPCSIYGKKKCLRGDYACLNNLSPDIIAYRVNFILRAKR